ncbi:flagellar hook-length control protein FliK [Asticcacaulis sp. AND118]|uniref:flagellar hook-length control protein FliK n=1 Tax=Asticcacaulis sp. AND118 TaxID=2840468 RepID=UPI001D00133D|nr:flagellar hook-length control protein FliK [Asticcacaulis sp. AND118]UDF03956.1 flagellar hook-length control protein FliK [Asticcacaulis sp. AND118]
MTPAQGATEAATPVSAVDAAETAGRFGQALASVQKDDRAALDETVGTDGDRQEDATAKASGELSAELLAVLLGQQTPQPVTPPASAETQAVEAQALAQGQASPATVSEAANPAAIAPELSAALRAELNGEGEEASAQDPFAEALDTFTGDVRETAEAKAEGRAETRQTSIEDALQSLSGAMKTVDDASATSQNTTQAANLTATQATSQSLAQMQAQVAPPNDSGLRFTPTPPTAQETVHTYSLSPHTAENIAALSAQISRRLGSKSTSFDMELRPTDMGKVDVKLEIGHDGKLTAHLRFDSPVAESEFKGRQDDLRRQLEQAGFQMDDASLNFASSDQGRGRQFAEAEPGDFGAPVTEPEAVAATDAHTLIDAQLMAAASADPTLYAQMSAGGYGQTRTLSLSVLV